MRLKLPLTPGMKKILRERLIANYYAERRTAEVVLRNFMRRVKPLDCSIDLIRVGGAGDGGYLIPNDLDGIDFCFSPGVSTSSEFENQLADHHIKSFLADFSVESPPINRPEFTFDKKYLGPTDGGEFFTLATWKEKYLRDYNGDLVLQMDIEGGEYGVILSTPSRLLNQFRIVVIEFHSLDRLLDVHAFPLISSCFDKLLESFYVVHVHPNNIYCPVELDGFEIPIIMEYTFLNKRRVRQVRPQLKFPHELDADNTTRKPVVLPRCWYLFDS
jgi:hypothetical protein